MEPTGHGEPTGHRSRAGSCDLWSRDGFSSNSLLPG